MNIEMARRTIAAVRSLGVTDFCVCSGSRNAPLLAVLGITKSVRLHSFVDERSAAFFALGIAKRQGRPACVVTTSGTAVAELLPAAVEAYYSGTPLVLLTADRPSRFRGTGAPQAIEQDVIFGGYATRHIEVWDGASPLHLNVEFDEPLIDGDVIESDASWPLRMHARATPSSDPVRIDFEQPVVIVGGLAEDDRPAVRDFLVRLNAPVYAEPLSGLREDAALRELLVANDRLLGRGRFDGIVRVGAVPTLRFWRDLDEKPIDLPVLNFSRTRFPGLSRGEVHPIESLPETQPRPRNAEFLQHDREMRERVDRVIDAEPESELALLRALSLQLPAAARVYLGNSLPVREWDLAATREPRGFAIEANRGANGIDGQLSTFFGWCAQSANNVAIVGDLTALYDMNAPWIASRLDAGFRIVIINNEGGRIFERVGGLRTLGREVRERVIDNAHALRFAPWAEMWSLDYSWASQLPAPIPSQPEVREVIEVVPDAEASRRVWARYDALWA